MKRLGDFNAGKAYEIEKDILHSQAHYHNQTNF